MPEGNPLVAPRQDSTTAYSGLGIAESAMDVYHGVENKSWVEGGLGVAGTGLETLSLALDPVGTLLSYGVAWLMEHVKPLSDALDWLAGDGDQIAAYAATWKNVGKETEAVAADFAAEVTNGTAGWQGEAADAYRTWARNQQAQITAAGTGANTIGTVVEVVGMLVGAVREIVRDLVAECVATLIARIPQWLAEIGGTLGIATPHVISAASALIAKWVNRIKDFILKLTRSLEKLRPIMDKLGEIWQAIRNGLTKAPEGTPHSASPVNTVKSPDADTPTTTPATSPDATTPNSTSPSGTTTDTPNGGKPSPDATNTTPSGTPDGPNGSSTPRTDAPAPGRQGGWGGGGYVRAEDSTPRAMAAYDRIRNSPEDVSRIAENTGLDPRILEEARQNLFVREHDIAYGPGPENLEHGRFTPSESYSDLWDAARDGNLTPEQYNQFRSLMAHEYVESRLMQEANLPYVSSSPSAWGEMGSRWDPENPSAHLLAPRSVQSSPDANLLSHWQRYGLTPPPGGIAPDLSNLDDVVRAAREGLNR